MRRRHDRVTPIHKILRRGAFAAPSDKAPMIDRAMVVGPMALAHRRGVVGNLRNRQWNAGYSGTIAAVRMQEPPK
jgi:hypothetical protein